MQHLPRLESLRFFEAAARHRSFALAGKELGVTPAAVAHRIRTLEQHLDAELFVRQQCSVRIVSVEAVAEKWLLPRLPTFKAGHPGIAIEIETDHRNVDPARRDFDAWLAYTGETAAPRPVTRHDYTLLEETLYDEALLPVCSPALIAARGRPRGPGPGRAAPLAAALRPRLGRRMVLLVRPPGRAGAGPLAGLGLSALLDAGRGGGERARRCHRTPDADREGAGEPNPGAALRPAEGGARALLPDHHRSLAAAAWGAGVPELDPARSARRAAAARRPQLRALPLTRRSVSAQALPVPEAPDP